MTMQINISEVVWDPSIYPRGNGWNPSTIKRYADVLKAGGVFPAIILEEGTNRLLDGKHRLEANKMYAVMYQSRDGDGDGEWPEPATKIDVEFKVIPDGIPAELYALSFSSGHGESIKNEDRKATARKIFTENPEFSAKEMAKYLGVSLRSVQGYVSDILALSRASKQVVAYRLNLLGWTQEEIGVAIESSQDTVCNILRKNADFVFALKSQIDSGLPKEQIAKQNNCPLQLVWAIALDGLDDQARMNKLEISIKPYDVWNFAKCHDLFGSQHPGRIPGDLIAHVLYFYTKPGDKVIDPMVGSGTTLDVCLALGRECYGFDIDERHDRPDVIKHNISVDGWHDRVKKADLIFWDPPYFEKMDSSNIGSDGYIEGSISKLSRDEYLKFFAQRLTEARGMVKKGCKLAFLMSDWDDNTGEREGVFIWDYANIISNAGWKLVRHIQSPLSTQQVHPDIVNKFRDSRRLARLERYLLIAEAG